MAYQTAISAFYYEQADIVEVIAAIVDDSNNQPINPSEIKSLSVTLSKRDTVVQQVADLDKYYACDDLQFRVRFSHPAHIRNLRVVTVFTLTDDSEYRKVNNVIIGQVEPSEGDFGDNAGAVLSNV